MHYIFIVKVGINYQPHQCIGIETPVHYIITMKYSAIYVCMHVCMYECMYDNETHIRIVQLCNFSEVGGRKNQQKIVEKYIVVWKIERRKERKKIKVKLMAVRVCSDWVRVGEGEGSG